jgi:hypothetical protein
MDRDMRAAFARAKDLAAKQFQVNKYLRMALSAVSFLTGVAMAVDWTKVFDAKTAGTIVATIGFVKGFYEYFAPDKETGTVPTGKAVITHVGDADATATPLPIVATHV